MAIWFPAIELSTATGAMSAGYQRYTVGVAAGAGGDWSLPDPFNSEITDGWEMWIQDKSSIKIEDGGLTITDPNGLFINGLPEVRLGQRGGSWRFTFFQIGWTMERYDFQNEILFTETFTAEALSGIQISDEHYYDLTNDVQYTSYRLKAIVPIFPDAATNVYIIYLGTIINPDSGVVKPHKTSGVVIADDTTFDQVTTAFTSRAVVTDDLTGDGTEGDAFVVILDDTVTAGVYDVYMLAAAAVDFTCECHIDFEFLITGGDRIAFTN
jgi:hypothetical protein